MNAPPLKAPAAPENGNPSDSLLDAVPQFVVTSTHGAELLARCELRVKAWNFWRLFWGLTHHIVGILGVLSSVIVGTQPESAPAWLRVTLAAVAGACSALLAFLAPERRAIAFTRAWRMLDHAVLGYRSSQQGDKDAQALLKAQYLGERILEQVGF